MVQLSKNVTDFFRRESWNKIHLGSFPDNILKKLKWLQFEFCTRSLHLSLCTRIDRKQWETLCIFHAPRYPFLGREDPKANA